MSVLVIARKKLIRNEAGLGFERMAVASPDIVVYGNKEVGKSSILQYWGCNEINSEKWEMDHSAILPSTFQPIEIKEKAKKYSIDQEISSKLSILIYVYDKSDMSSLHALYSDFDDLAKHKVECDAIIVLGHKNDTKTYEDNHVDLLYDFISHHMYFRKLHFSYFATSTTTGENLGIVLKYFVELSKSMLKTS